MLTRKVRLPPDQRSLLDSYLALAESDRSTLLAFAEFLVSRPGRSMPEPAVPAQPTVLNPIPRPSSETVIGAIKRLSETYPMIDRKELLTESSSLMSAHIMQGRAASAVIDELEALFALHYKRITSAGE